MGTKGTVYGFSLWGYSFKPEHAWEYHRGWPGVGFTHTPAWGIVLALLVLWLFKSREWALGLLIGQWAHVLTDCFDSVGVMLFFPSPPSTTRPACGRTPPRRAGTATPPRTTAASVSPGTCSGWRCCWPTGARCARVLLRQGLPRRPGLELAAPPRPVLRPPPAGALPRVLPLRGLPHLRLDHLVAHHRGRADGLEVGRSLLDRQGHRRPPVGAGRRREHPAGADRTGRPVLGGVAGGRQTAVAAHPPYAEVEVVRVPRPAAPGSRKRRRRRAPRTANRCSAGCRQPRAGLRWDRLPRIPLPRVRPRIRRPEGPRGPGASGGSAVWAASARAKARTRSVASARRHTRPSADSGTPRPVRTPRRAARGTPRSARRTACPEPRRDGRQTLLEGAHLGAARDGAAVRRDRRASASRQ
ncbi:metal-dependent hydrolase [Streptomyces sp. M19]